MDVFRKDLLKGKVAVITGGGSGINLGIAETLAQYGARVVLIGRTKEKLDAACAGIEKAGGKASAEPLDVRDYPALDAAMKRTRETIGEIDILVNGAAGNFPAPAVALSANGFKSVVDIDLLGTFNTCRAAFEHLRKPGASIVNISAGQAFNPSAMQIHVCAAKAGVDMCTKVLALEWGGAGVRVNSIVPGPIEDTEGMRRLAGSEKQKQRVIEAVPLGRYGTKQDIANMTLFLCSPAASFVTGAVITCDGGMNLNGSGLLLRGLMES